MPSDGAARHPDPDRKPFEELRTLLLGPEQEALDSMRQRMDNPKRRAEDVAGVLADAVRLRSDAKLRRALQPLLEESLQLSVRANPQMLADALFPIFGQAIRKSIAAELDRMTESLNQALEQKISLRSIGWRLESWRTGKSYTEVVLLRSLLYRVEQVFLIHRNTGLLLQHVTIPSADVKDPDMVSGMLTAIQDFVRDSMSGAEGQSLDVVRMGDVRVVLAYTRDAILCAFVRGVAPASLNRVFQEKLDGIALQKGEALQKFSGDTSAFDSCRPQLEACLLGQGEAQASETKSRSARFVLIGIPCLVILAIAAWAAYSLVMNHRLSEFADRVAAQPGFVVTQTQKSGGRLLISGLRDPLALDPVSLLAGSGVPKGKVDFRWQDYHSLAPEFVNQRRFAELKEQLERRVFRFGVAQADLPPEQHFLLDDVASQITELLQAGAALGKSPVVEVRGNHDPVGAEETNATLAKERATNVRDALISMGIPAARLTAEAADRDRQECAAIKAEERLACRSASFAVREAAR